jgi:hypothetical protein
MISPILRCEPKGVGFPPSTHRDEQAAKHFLSKDIRRHGLPEPITIDGSVANAAGLSEHNAALQRSGNDTAAYDVTLSRPTDGGPRKRLITCAQGERIQRHHPPEVPILITHRYVADVLVFHEADR